MTMGRQPDPIDRVRSDDNNENGDEEGDGNHRGGFVLNRRLAERIQNVHRREVGSVTFEAEDGSEVHGGSPQG